MRRFIQRIAAAGAFLLALRGLAAFYASPAGALYDGELSAQEELARGVDRWVDADLTRGDFSTGSSRFDGEWLFATRMMAVLGYAQTAAAHPSLRADHAARIDAALDALVAPEGRAFDAEAWGRDPIDDLGSERAHAAYLGYLALALALARDLNPDTRHAALEARIVAHLVGRFEASRIGLLESYPGEVYPIDNCAFFGALGVHDRVTGEDHSALTQRLLARLTEDYRDPRSGLLVQSVAPEDGARFDGPRGSGTALAAYYLSFVDLELSGSLYGSIRDGLANDTLGFGTVREYPRDTFGFGDVDSGPVIFGQGVSATGFTLALARIHGDRERFEHLYATAAIVGGPIESGGTHYALGGPIGDALLFAMATALPADAPWRQEAE